MGRKKPKQTILDNMVQARISLPHIAELVGFFMREAGGMEGFAKMLMEEYKAALPGSLIRQRVLEMVMRMTTSANAQMPPAPEADSMDQSDIERELTELIGSLPEEPANGRNNDHQVPPANH